jgi:hypothetical protein
MRAYLLEKGFKPEMTTRPRHKFEDGEIEPYESGSWIDPDDPEGWRHNLENSFFIAIMKYDQHPIIHDPDNAHMFDEEVCNPLDLDVACVSDYSEPA